jgi:16S rRNA (uracil1498-N3)-methyltransferase
MSEPRFYCAELSPGLMALDAAETRHALQSLRLRPGDAAVLFDGRGRIAHGVLQANAETTAGPRGAKRTKGRSRGAVFAVEHVLCESPPSVTLTLIVAGCKGSRLSWMVEKLTELGTTGIIIAEFERSVVHVGPTHARKLRRTAIEAAKQSARAWLPEISCGVTLERAIAGVEDRALLVTHPADEVPTLSSRLHVHELVGRHLAAVVGPEGGLSEGEVLMLRKAGGQLVRLADTILRVETAAISVAANWAARHPV